MELRAGLVLTPVVSSAILVIVGLPSTISRVTCALVETLVGSCPRRGDLRRPSHGRTVICRTSALAVEAGDVPARNLADSYRAFHLAMVRATTRPSPRRRT